MSSVTDWLVVIILAEQLTTDKHIVYSIQKLDIIFNVKLRPLFLTFVYLNH